MKEMRNANKHKNNEMLGLICGFVIIMMIVGIIYIPKITSKAYTNSNSSNDRVLKILDVEPSEKDDLKLKKDNDSQEVEITSMDMSRFISMVDEISGKYDIVYIGNNNTALKDNWNRNIKYRKYSDMTSLEWGNLGNKTGDGADKWRQQIIWYGIGGYVPGNNSDWDKAGKYYSALYGNNACTFSGRLDENDEYHKYVEYYSENDITNKRAKEIIKLLDTNQLVYMDSSILDTYKNTKLSKNFEKYRQNGKLKMVNNSSGLVSNMINDYNSLDEDYKRPIIKFDSDSDKPQDGSRTLNFKFYLEGNTNANYKAYLYIDLDGDGIFDNEPYQFNNKIKVNEENTLSYNLGKKIIGYVNWKLVICDSKTNIKSYETGNITISSKNNTSVKPKSININVLQVHPTDFNNGSKKNNCNFDMASNSEFQNLLQNSSELSDYNISITSESISYFNGNCNYNELSGKYDMIILGFGDGYGVGKENQFTDTAINSLLQWNKAKKSLMFSHDIIGLSVLHDTKTSDNNGWTIYNQNYGAYNLSRNFKDIVGQCRFKQDPFVNFSERDKHLEVKDNYDDLSEYNNKITSDIRTLGITAYANIKLYDETRAVANDMSVPSEVELVNKSQISSYPFNLNGRKLKVASTHCQWYQLNLENEDIVPSYNLSNERIDSGDARNFYYTYTKGNITYTGSGDSTITNERDEMKLFINTMIKAYTAGNSTPDVTNYNQETNAEIEDNSTLNIDLSNLEEGTPFVFKSKISDDSAQGEKLNVNITEGNNTLYNNILDYDGSIEGMFINDLTISYDELKANIGNTIPVRVTVTDEQGAAITKSFNIKVSSSKLNVINGINKDEENIIKNYSNYEKQWYESEENAGPSGTLSNDILYSNTNIASEGTRGYQCIIPFISEIDTNITNNISISLKLDKNYAKDINNTLDFAEAYYEDKEDSICEKPCLYAKYNGKLFKVKSLERSTLDGSYKTSVSLKELQNAGVDITIGSDCTLVVKYYGKTYNHNTDEDNSVLTYTNEIIVSQGERIVNSTVKVNVGYKKLSGNLF